MKEFRVFGENLKAARQSKGLSQEALGHASGLHRTYVGAVERGERNLSLKAICQLAQALDVSPASLLAGLAAGGGAHGSTG